MAVYTTGTLVYIPANSLFVIFVPPITANGVGIVIHHQPIKIPRYYGIGTNGCATALKDLGLSTVGSGDPVGLD